MIDPHKILAAVEASPGVRVAVEGVEACYTPGDGGYRRSRYTVRVGEEWLWLEWRSDGRRAYWRRMPRGIAAWTDGDPLAVALFLAVESWPIECWRLLKFCWFVAREVPRSPPGTRVFPYLGWAASQLQRWGYITFDGSTMRLTASGESLLALILRDEVTQ